MRLEDLTLEQLIELRRNITHEYNKILNEVNKKIQELIIKKHIREKR